MNIKKIFVLLLFLVAIIGIIAPVNATIDPINSENKVYTIGSKEKTAKFKITWNANGGKIGNKKTTVTTVKKGNKINKLATTPKRSGYTFKGWYTKKTGGKKISVNTKPSKSVTLYASGQKRQIQGF
ncbi:MAG: InlB B-repeat-containing protein [Methanobrevibacter sp.]|nr:InlB B-repeat-containing protein [Methanobrevibacter sp.]